MVRNPSLPDSTNAVFRILRQTETAAFSGRRLLGKIEIWWS
jgi:hypothetical protein